MPPDTMPLDPDDEDRDEREDDFTDLTGQDLHEAVTQLTPLVRTAIRAALRATRIWRKIARAAYAEAGAPYGPGDDGLWRWLREVADPLPSGRALQEAFSIEMQCLHMTEALQRRFRDAGNTPEHLN